MKKFIKKITHTAKSAVTCVKTAAVNSMSAVLAFNRRAVCSNAGEGYIDTAVKVLIAVVLGALVLAGLLLARGALFLALGLAMGFPGGTPWGRFVVFTALSWAVSMTLYALQQGLSLRFANQAVALVCGIFGSFVGLMALLFPVWVQRCVPWGYYGLLSLVRMEWDEATRWTAFFWRRPEPLDLALLCLWAALFLTVGRTLFVRKEV